MPFKSKFLKALLGLSLGFATFTGAGLDPKKIEELLNIMNRTNVEVMIPERNDKGEPELPAIEVPRQEEDTRPG